jgi:[acyl-carrier-protein] S-malonyltransferase
MAPAKSFNSEESYIKMQTAMLFPGQGSQAVGMGRDIYDRSDLPCRARFDEADRLLGRGLTDIIFNGPAEELMETRNTQPALFVVEAALADLLAASGITPVCAAGHSLGEYGALYAASVITFEDGLRLVAARGEAMAEAGRERPGAMVAILGMEKGKVAEVISRVKSGVVVCANENAPEQTVLSGEAAAVNEACELLKAAGARRAVPLSVSGAFHSPLMKPAAEKLAVALDAVKFSSPQCPVITNVTARPETDPALLKDLLIKQLVSPVRWVESMKALHELSPQSCMEVGPGTVLKVLAKKCVPEMNILTCDTVNNVYSVLGHT